MKELMKLRTFARSMRNTPPVPPQVPFRPNEVTPPTTIELPTKLGPPESPKQVPPVEAVPQDRPGPVLLDLPKDVQMGIMPEEVDDSPREQVHRHRCAREQHRVDP